MAMVYKLLGTVYRIVRHPPTLLVLLDRPHLHAPLEAETYCREWVVRVAERLQTDPNQRVKIPRPELLTLSRVKITQGPLNAMSPLKHAKIVQRLIPARGHTKVSVIV